MGGKYPDIFKSLENNEEILYWDNDLQNCPIKNQHFNECLYKKYISG